MKLPVSYSSIENLLGDILDHLRYQLFLNGVQRASCVVCCCSSKLTFEIFRVIGIVGESHVDCH